MFFYKKINCTKIYTGKSTIIENLNIYPKNEGIFTPLSSAIALTMKFGPLPIYVIAPKNTEPIQIAFNNSSGIPATIPPPKVVICSGVKPVATL